MAIGMKEVLEIILLMALANIIPSKATATTRELIWTGGGMGKAK